MPRKKQPDKPWPNFPDELLEPIQVSSEKLVRDSRLLEKYRTEGKAPHEVSAALEAEVQKLREEYIRQVRADKMLLLAQYYNLRDLTREVNMSFARLALDFVPGLKVAEVKDKGRPNTWTELEYLRLWIAVHEETKSGKTAKDVCRNLVKKEPWKSLISPKAKSRTSAQNLYEHYANSVSKSRVLQMTELLAEKLGVPMHDALDIARAANETISPWSKKSLD
jgi:hypothetical protein